MSNTFNVVTTYSFSLDTEVELPEGKTIADIEDIYVKWGTVMIQFKDGTALECQEAEFNAGDHVDWKRPGETEFYATSDDGWCYADFEKPLQIPEENKP